MTRNGQSTLQRQLLRGGALAHEGLDKKAVVDAAHELGLALFVANCDPARSRSAVLRAIVKAVDFPEYFGGNLDVKHLNPGATLYLPVGVEGALFSLGDTHAAQGDGEVCGTAIESRMDVELTIELVKDARLESPRFTTPGPVTRHLDAGGYEVTTGIGPDLMTAARESVMRMVDLLSTDHGLKPVDAYMLCSVCGDLRISEIVDMPNWVVSFYFPRIVFS